MLKRKSKTSCPYCGGRLAAGAVLCPSCGSEVLGQKESEHCPACGARMLASEGSCPICGARRQVVRAASHSGIWAAVAGLVVLLGLAGAVWLVKPWSEMTALLLPTSTVPLRPSRPTLARTATHSPTPTEVAVISASLTVTQRLSTSVVSSVAPAAVATPTATSTPILRTTTPTLAPTPTRLVHVVKEGDVLVDIAAQYDVSTDDLIKANNMAEDDLLHIGQELVIPVTAAASEAPATPAGTPPAGPTSMATQASPTSNPTATAASAPATALPTAIQTPTPEIHIVKSGEVLGGIAAEHDVSTEDLAQANDIEEDTILHIGQELVIPIATPTAASQPTATAPAATPTAPTTAATPAPSPSGGSAPAVVPTAGPVYYTVEAGDTLMDIAVKYNVTSEDIVKANNMSIWDTLSIGQRLVIPGVTPQATSVPPPSATPQPQQTSTPTATRRPTIAPPLATSTAVYPYSAPHLLAPVNDARVEGEQTQPLLNWLSVGILAENEWYLIMVWRTEAGADQDSVAKVWTKATSYRLPADLYPKGQVACELYWQVKVASQASEDTMVTLSPPSEIYRFCWR
jgi:LysM repeat protein